MISAAQSQGSLLVTCKQHVFLGALVSLMNLPNFNQGVEKFAHNFTHKERWETGP